MIESTAVANSGLWALRIFTGDLPDRERSYLNEELAADLPALRDDE